MPHLEEFHDACEFSRTYPQMHGGLPANDERCRPQLGRLESLKEYFTHQMRLRGCAPHDVKVSRGVGAFPRVTHICFLPPGQNVSNGIYAGVCFGASGRGAVVGCLKSVTSVLND